MPESKLFKDIEVGTDFVWRGGNWKKTSRNHAEFQGRYLENVPGDDAVFLRTETDEPQEEPHVARSTGHEASKASQPSNAAKPEKPDAGTA